MSARRAGRQVRPAVMRKIAENGGKVPESLRD